MPEIDSAVLRDAVLRGLRYSGFTTHDMDDHVDELTTVIGAALHRAVSFVVSREEVDHLANARMTHILGASLWKAQPADLKEKVRRSIAEELTMAGVEVEQWTSHTADELRHTEIEQKLITTISRLDHAYCTAHGIEPMQDAQMTALAHGLANYVKEMRR